MAPSFAELYDGLVSELPVRESMHRHLESKNVLGLVPSWVRGLFVWSLNDFLMLTWDFSSCSSFPAIEACTLG